MYNTISNTVYFKCSVIILHLFLYIAYAVDDYLKMISELAKEDDATVDTNENG
jgi:hypothetical protein